MRIRFLYVLFPTIVIGFSFYACNSNHSTNIEKQSLDTTVVFPSDSFAFYEKVLETDSLNTELRMALATNYYVEKQFNKAIDHLLIVCRIDNKNIEAIITIGNVYYDDEQNEKAIYYYEKALALDNKNVNVRCDLATCYLNIKKPELACSLLKKNIDMEYNHAQSHHNLSVVYKELGKIKEADEEMKIFNKLSK